MTRSHRGKMLRGEDVARTIWQTITMPANVYIEDILIRDSLQHFMPGADQSEHSIACHMAVLTNQNTSYSRGDTASHSNK